MPGIFDMSPPSTSIPLPFFFIRAWHWQVTEAATRRNFRLPLLSTYFCPVYPFMFFLSFFVCVGLCMFTFMSLFVLFCLYLTLSVSFSFLVLHYLSFSFSQFTYCFLLVTYFPICPSHISLL